MNNHMLSVVAKLSDKELLEKIPVLAQREREASAALIAHLTVFDERQLYLGQGCSSLFTYCTEILHFSEHAAFNRIEAARAARRYPVILEMLASGAVNLTTVRLLAPELTSANHRELLEAAQHKSKRQVLELIARLRPMPPVPSTIRRLPASSHAPMQIRTMDAGSNGTTGGQVPDFTYGSLQVVPNTSPERLPACTAPPPAPLPPGHRPTITPLAPERYKVQFTVSAETQARLRLAQNLLRHQIPDGDLGQIIDRALTALLKELARQKIAATEHPRGGRGLETKESDSGSRHIPAEVKRTVWLRDQGQCAFMTRHGRRCTERGFLEFHHVVPFSAGGKATPNNIELRCRAHNGYEAKLLFGQAEARASTRPGTS